MHRASDLNSLHQTTSAPAYRYSPASVYKIMWERQLGAVKSVSLHSRFATYGTNDDGYLNKAIEYKKR
jgi:hypothetical protein